MEALFLLTVGLVVSWFAFAQVRGSVDHVFSPAPGYILIFSLFFLMSSLSLPFAISEDQWLSYTLAIFGFAAPALLPWQFRRWSLLSDRAAHFARAQDYYFRSFNGALLVVLWLIGCCAVGLAWSQTGIPLLSGNVDQARVIAQQNGYIGTLSSTLDVIALFSLIYVFSARGRAKDWRFWMALVAIISFILVAGLAGSRSRLLKFAIPSLVAYHFAVRPLKLRWIACALPLGAAFVGLLGYYRAYVKFGLRVAEGLGVPSDTPVWRLAIHFALSEVSTATYGLSIVFRLFPQQVPFTHGWLHLGPFVAPLQGKIPLPGEYYKDLIGGTWDGFGLAATFISPMYADFGLAGVIGLSVIYGALILYLYSRAAGFRSDCLYYIGLYSLLFYFMLSSIRSDFVSFDLLWFLLVGLLFNIFKAHAGVRRLDGRVVNDGLDHSTGKSLMKSRSADD